jgi:hypothetical protein
LHQEFSADAKIIFMTNWKVVSEAYGVGIPESELEGVIVPLQGLEQAFGKISTSFPADSDSALTFDASLGAK